MPNTVTFQVAVQKLCCQLPDSQLANVRALIASKDPKTLNIRVDHETFGPDFSWLQCSNGYRFRHCDRVATGEEAKAVHHLLYTVSAYTWCRRKADMNQYYWLVDDIIKHWAVDQYPKELLARLKKEKAEEIARYPSEMQEWVDKYYA
jgi:hypothetical protein